MGNPETATMTMQALVKHTNVLVNTVAENQALREQLAQATDMLNQQLAVIKQLEERLADTEASPAVAEGEEDQPTQTKAEAQAEG